MIDTKYGLKYSFPHSMVHIVDNSGNDVVDTTTFADDPSLYSTIVVTGAPMGEDGRMINITRSDVLNVAFGMSNLTASDVEKYGQAVRYAPSLIAQGAPVKFMRVTPPGSTYAVATVLVQWRIVNQKFEVRFKIMDGSDTTYGYNARGIDLSRYKNTDRLNRAIVTSVKNTTVWPSDYNGWTTRVLLNFISAGRGATYNNMTAFVNRAEQTKKPINVRYEFGTIDTRTNQIIEDFYACLINNASFDSRNQEKKIDTVNVAVKKRVDGSSVVVPYVNEEAIGEIWNAYKALFTSIVNGGSDHNIEYASNKDLYDAIYAKLNINTFDVIFGKYVYQNDIEVDLPFYQVDMYDIAVPKMDSAHQIHVNTSDTTDPRWSRLGAAKVSGKWPDWAIQDIAVMMKAPELVGVSYNADYTGPYVGDVYLTTNGGSPVFNMATAINQYSGAVSVMTIPRVYPVTKSGSTVTVDTTQDVSNSPAIKAIYPELSALAANIGNPDEAALLEELNKRVSPNALAEGDVIVLGAAGYNKNTASDFRLAKVGTLNPSTKKPTSLILYPLNLYKCLDFRTTLNGDAGTDNIIVRDSKVTTSDTTESSNIPAWKIDGALRINDTTDNVSSSSLRYVRLFINDKINTYPSDVTKNPSWTPVGASIGINGATTQEIKKIFKIGSVPSYVSITNSIVGSTYDVFAEANTTIEEIDRVVVTGVINSTIKISSDPTVIPTNYYDENYGDSLYSAAGGVSLAYGSAGFFDDPSVNSIVFKWKYNELMTSAFKGEIDPRIMSPTRMPAKFLFDAGWNTTVGLTQLPFTYPDIADVIYASTIFTDDEKSDVQYDQTLLSGIGQYADIDVKQAMYDLMVYRCYQGIPEDKRPIGPGSGLSLHLDGGNTDAATAIAINKSFSNRFDNPNASWDIGGYVDAIDGVSYTYTKRLVDNLIAHCKTYTINKPYVGKYTTIRRDEYISYFPDIDTTDWELRELFYNSGGNAWIADTNGDITRRSQRTLMRSSNTSDLLQESNMRTLSQLVYLLQNKIDTYLLEYDDDGVLKTLAEDCTNMFSGWVGTRVQALSISFERDTNIDGGDIVVCYVNVTFRGLILRVPIIVNVNRRANRGGSSIDATFQS